MHFLNLELNGGGVGQEGEKSNYQANGKDNPILIEGLYYENSYYFHEGFFHITTLFTYIG